MQAAVLIVAAGRGSRFGGELPKQYALLDGKPVIRRTIEAFLDHPGIGEIRVVIHPDDVELYRAACAGLEIAAPVFGGAERQDSVRNGLEALASASPDAVLIHDAARPAITPAVIDAVLSALSTEAGAIPVLPVVDTLKRRGDGPVLGATFDRASVLRAQTPQGFRFADILAAHRAAAGNTLTDDAAVMEAAGHRVVGVAGEERNIKITTNEDLEAMQSTSAPAFEFRTGNGYDVHRFEPGDAVIICGVTVPHTGRLAGHSDADVGLHAITDALLGAIAEGDIGDHFPPSDPQWRGAASDRFLAHACDLVRKKGGETVNVDVTIVCEAPKIGPHRTAMRERVAGILGLDAARVSVKATTTEKLGFTGRREGIAALATATVRLPA
jgi:2-C-methyl-D-erythritol 4-phosphate cytidylyltransferase/2-C-methyl-D-erythritol 2,4-cyclodiphosphate synthase